MNIKERLSADRRKYLKESGNMQHDKKNTSVEEEAKNIISNVLEPTFDKIYEKYRGCKGMEIKIVAMDDMSYTLTTMPNTPNVITKRLYANLHLIHGEVWKKVIELANDSGIIGDDISEEKANTNYSFKLILDD